MKQIRKYLDDAKDTGIVRNDTEMAEKLNIGRATVCEWRKGRSAPNEDQAAALAELLEKPEIMAESAAARAKTERGKKTWEWVAATLAIAMKGDGKESWRARDDSNVRPLPSEGSTLSS